MEDPGRSLHVMDRLCLLRIAFPSTAGACNSRHLLNCSSVVWSKWFTTSEGILETISCDSPSPHMTRQTERSPDILHRTCRKTSAHVFLSSPASFLFLDGFAAYPINPAWRRDSELVLVHAGSSKHAPPRRAERYHRETDRRPPGCTYFPLLEIETGKRRHHRYG